MEKLFSNDSLCAYARAFVGQPYWYGTYINNCTESKLQQKAKQYPSHYGSSRMSRYRQDIANGKTCADCVGFDKGAAWGNLGKRSPVYASNGVPDKSADGMFQWAKDKGASWGSIGTIPEMPGLAVRFAGHVGTYLGNGKVFEERGFAYGAVITNLKSRPWTHWYERPWVLYGNTPNAPTPSPAPVETLGSRLLKNYTTGDDVRSLQAILIDLGYGVGKDGADGKYGGNTEKAVKEFQKKEGLSADGKYGEKSHAALMGVLAERDRDENDEPVAETTKTVRVTGGSVYARAGASTAYKIETVTHKGMIFPWVATAENGWHNIIVSGKSVWISGRYTSVE